MKKAVFLFIFAALIGIFGAGCTGTVKGVKHDVGNAYDATVDTVQEIGR